MYRCCRRARARPRGTIHKVENLCAFREAGCAHGGTHAWGHQRKGARPPARAWRLQGVRR